jgi:hypothetical protein
MGMHKLKALLKFDYPVMVNGKVVWRHNEEKIVGDLPEIREYVNYLKKYGSKNMKNIDVEFMGN